ncbi:hypothetical protein SNE40_015690 [Patella caerulea]|uniref:Hint domain-containing protein n=1 Tax=Patella caerulea TaxID=87958 RepID=A0AAN8PJN8_PATCE
MDIPVYLLAVLLCITQVQADVFFHHGDTEVRYVTKVKNGQVDKRDECSCYCKRKWGTDAWDCCACGWADNICFPGDVSLTLESGEVIAMDELKQGHRVLAVTEGGQLVFSEVKTFLKRYPDNMAVYLDLITEDGQTMSLSESHVIFSSTTNNTKEMIPNFAGRVNIGDYLFTTDNCQSGICPVKVKTITHNVRKGVYVPLTDEGTVVVSNMVASCYSSINHHLAHLFMTPIRRYPWLLGDYQQQGYSPFISFLKNLGHWILPNNMQFDLSKEGFVAARTRTDL